MILAIDPGNIESGVVIVDEKTLRPYFAEKMNNEELINAFMINVNLLIYITMQL